MQSIPLLDTILFTYLSIINGGFAQLIPIGMGILAVVALFELRLAFMWAAIDGDIDFVRLFGLAFMPLLLTAVLAYLMQSVPTWTDEALQMFLRWGASVTAEQLGSAPLVPVMSSPSAIFALGFEVTTPLWDFMTSFWSLFAEDGWFIMITYWLCWLLTIIFFAVMAIDVMMALIEFKVAGLAVLVLVPWGALRHTSFLMWVGWEWIVAVGIKLFVLVMLISVAILSVAAFGPLRAALTNETPKAATAVVLLVSTFVIAAVAHTLPSIAAARIGGGGGLNGTKLLYAAVVPMATIRAGTQVVRGFSNLVR